jgi:hypothetical protein
MTLPNEIILDGTSYTIFQHQNEGGHRPKAINDEMTVTGKRSRQIGWLPREWTVTIWADADIKDSLEAIWEEDGSSTYAHTFKLGSDGDLYNVTLDDFKVQNKEAPQARYLIEVLFKEFPS